MQYIALARKYRSRQFTELVGQEHVSTTLLNAFKQGKVGQAYLFTGTRGVGKTSAARILARALRCEHPDSQPGKKNYGMPCDTCPACMEINNGTSIDVLEIDGASNNGVDNVRELRESAKFMPARGSKKVYIIDEVHMLTGAAFNALLKTLEEPPAHITFILATTEVQKIPATILSRCQRFDFKRIPQAVLFDHMSRLLEKEKIKADASALRIIARKADGSARDALSALEQVLALAGKEITPANTAQALGLLSGPFLAKLLHATLSEKILDAMTLVQEAFGAGAEMKQLAVDLAETTRNAVLLKLGAPTGVVEISEEEKKDLAPVTEICSVESLQAAFRIFAQSIDEIARSPLPRAALEMTLVRAHSVGNLASVTELLERVSQVPVQRKAAAPASAVHAAAKVQQAPQASTSAPKSEPIPQTTAAPAAPRLITWSGVVQHVLKEKPALGTLLEHAVLLTPVEQWKRADTKSHHIEIGFKETFYLQQAEKPQTSFSLHDLFARYLGGATKIAFKHIKSAPGANAGAGDAKAAAPAPASLVEAENTQRREHLDSARKKFLEQPIMKDAQEIFGSEISGFDITTKSTKGGPAHA